MKILFIISCYKKGQGGHYHSLDHISRQLSKSCLVHIAILGGGNSPVIESNPNFYKKLSFNGTSFYSLNNSLKRCVEEIKPDIIHCFDPDCYLVLQLLPVLKNFKFVVNRCGGPNPIRKKWILFDNIVVFSTENFDWLNSNNRYKESNVFIIPNRIFRIELKEEPKRTILKDNDKFSFVRIARIGSPLHLNSIWKSILLVEKLSFDYSHVQLYIIGTIENIVEFEKIKSYVENKNLPVLFITDEQTKKASELLYLADCVIGIGRSLMEAMSLGIPVLVPASNSEIPVLLDNSNFISFFNSNFSQRSIASQVDVEKNMDNISRLLEKKTDYKKYSEITKSLFDIHLDIEQINEKYNKVYQTALNMPRKRYFLANILYTFQMIINIIKNNRK